MTLRPPIAWCWDRLHHAYIGSFILTIGYLTKNKWIMIIGVLVIIDDIIEHSITADSPLRLIYESTIQSSLPQCQCDECEIA